ncbi:SART-1 family protein DOT2-like [Aristolochia californica]|uniref:SART-1 family protein DOT2-like n=1 Tax=Aristolochia californica TaxID=171875 RepID=UPI0035DFD93D
MELEEGEHIGDGFVKNDVDMEVIDSTKPDNSKEKSRESGKHRSKDRKGRREDKEIGIRERERSKTHDGVKEKDKELERHETREKDRMLSRERRVDDREEHKKEHEKSGNKEKLRDKDYDHEKYRERDRYRGRDQEKDHDKDKERGRDHAKDRERDRDREKEHSKSRVRDWEFEKESKKDWEKERITEKNRDREKDRDGDRNKEKLPEGAKDKERKKERGKEHERDREKEKDKDREKLDKDRHKEKNKDKDRQRERAKEREKDMLDEKRLHQGLEREMGKVKEGGSDEKLKFELDEVIDASRQTNNVDLHLEISREGQKYMNREPSGSQQSSLDLQQRTLKMREKRLKKNSEGASEILSWVDKSRKLEEKINTEKQKAQQLSKIFEEQDNVDEGESEDEETAIHTSKDLAGVKILHGLDKVLEGGAVVLTLKDQSILAKGDVNDEIDMLENVEIGEQKQRDEAYKAAKKKTGIYEDKFSDDPSTQRTILPQYDDPVEDEGVKLDESGRFTGEAEKKLEELRKRLQGASTSNRFEDLTSSAKTLSDYYTQEEMLQFRKPKKKKSLRKKNKLDLDALEAEAIAAGLGVGDLGSKDDAKRQSAKEEKEKSEAEMRSSAYQSALAKAEEASRALWMEQTLTVERKEDENPVFGEDDEDLYKSLEKARKLALKKQGEASLFGPQVIAQLAVANSQSGGLIENDKSTPGEEAEESKVIFSEVEEFVSSVGLPEENPKPETEDVFMVEADYPKSAEETKDEDGGWSEVKDSVMDELPAEEETEDVKADAIIDEPVVGKGLSGALMLLKDRGTLKEGIDWGGRNMDKKKSKLVGINDDDNAKEILIERLDEFGRVMTPKEAFRRISHKFHGKGPGKMKTEKRQKQYQEELKLKQMKASDTPSLSVERMRETQARLQTPYLVLSGHVKPGQTSDPRSGFATIEKDHHGSLTPMLGDKKVEHFLGIKRKAEPSNLGLPKKLNS